MPSSTVGTFTDQDEYVTNLHGMAVELAVTSPGRFDGRQTWVRLPHIDLLRAQELRPRVAYVSLQRPLLFATFVVRPGPTLLLNGVALEPGEIAFHADGERFHQRTTGAANWGLLAMAPRFASIYGAAIVGPLFQIPRDGHFVCPSSTDATQFLRLHARIAHLVETRPVRVCHPEVARALEQELIYALMTCSSFGEMRPMSEGTRRHTEILARFEHQLTAHPDRVLPMPELCTLIGTSEAILSTCCTEFLGMTPSRYLRLRRLSRVHRAMLNADPNVAKVGEIARSHSFTEPGHFAVAYRAAFGETPSTTLRRGRHASEAISVPWAPLWASVRARQGRR